MKSFFWNRRCISVVKPLHTQKNVINLITQLLLRFCSNVIVIELVSIHLGKLERFIFFCFVLLCRMKNLDAVKKLKYLPIFRAYLITSLKVDF